MTMPSTSSTTTTGSATRGESAPASAAAVIETATIARNEPASTSSKTLEDLDLCVVAHDEAVGLRQRRAASDLHVLADQARLDAVVEVAHLRAREHDRVLQLGALDPDVLADRGVGADVGVGQLRAGADDRGPAHGAADQLGSRLDGHAPLHARVGELSLVALGQVVEDQPISLQHVLHLAGVLPPAMHHVG